MEKETIKNLINAAELRVAPIITKYEETALFNQQKVLEAMQRNRLSERHFMETTGYGYNDEGREICERIFSDVFQAERSLVRPQIVSGTHAIALSLFGVLRPGDEMLSITGLPYDTIQSAIGLNPELKGQGTLADYQITYNQSSLTEDGEIDINDSINKINQNTKLIYIQRSTGYALRKAITIKTIQEAVQAIKQRYPDMIVLIDNCYGEFLEEREPLEVGADIIAGSLIKNPGGGIALSGGYISGKENYLSKIASRLTVPGLGDEVGANLGSIRGYLQGFFLAPHITLNAIKGALLTGAVFEDLGYDVFPKTTEDRSDIIQAVILKDKESVLKYCRAVQASSPVDSYATPQPWDMPGYDDEIIMAAGNFIQGSSIELSADAPMREPYVVYQQGGLTYEHIKIALINILCEL